MKILITILLLCMLMPAASALTPTNVMSDTMLKIHQCPDSVMTDEYVLISGQLSYANSEQLTIEYMNRIAIDIYVNGELVYGYTMCNSTGGFHAYLKHKYGFDDVPYQLKPGKNEIKCVFKGKEYYGLLPSESAVHTIYVNKHPTQDYDNNTDALKLIGYAKGFFALSWFSMLFVTIGVGCISIQSDNPQTKADSQARLFFLGKMLLTVTIVFLAVLFMAP